MAAQVNRDTRLFFIKTFDVSGEYREYLALPRLVKKMIGVQGCNIRAITRKISGTSITLSAHGYKNASGEEIEAINKLCAVIRANDVVYARRVVDELSALKDKCENPARLTWTPKNNHPGAFIGKGAVIIRSFNKKHNVHCWYDNEACYFVIESIERKNVLAALADLDRLDVRQSRRPSQPPPSLESVAGTNSFAALADDDAEERMRMISLDEVKSTPESESFPSIGAVTGPVTPRGKWSARREDTMATITAVPVPPPAPKKAPRPVKLTKKFSSPPVMQSLDDDDCVTKSKLEWWDDSEEEDLDDFGPVIKRQTSFKEGTATEGLNQTVNSGSGAPRVGGPWRIGEAPEGVITFPCLLPDGSRGVAALGMPE